MRLYLISAIALLAGCGSSSFDFANDQSTNDSDTSETSEASQTDADKNDSQQDASAQDTLSQDSSTDSAMSETSSPHPDAAKEADSTGIACGLGNCAEGEVCCVSSSISTCKKSCDIGENTVACQASSDCGSSNPICCAQLITDYTCCFAGTCGLSMCSGASIACYPQKIKTSVCQASLCKSNFDSQMCSIPSGISPVTAQVCNSATDCKTGSCCKAKGSPGYRICGTSTIFFDDCLK